MTSWWPFFYCIFEELFWKLTICCLHRSKKFRIKIFSNNHCCFQRGKPGVTVKEILDKSFRYLDIVPGSFAESLNIRVSGTVSNKIRFVIHTFCWEYRWRGNRATGQSSGRRGTSQKVGFICRRTQERYLASLEKAVASIVFDKIFFLQLCTVD